MTESTNNTAPEAKTASADNTNTVATTATTVNITVEKDNKDTYALIGFIISIVNLCSWFLPLCGFPMTIAGLVLCYLGLKSKSRRTLAIIGLVISAFGLLATIANAALGASMAMSGNGLNIPR